MRSEQRYHRASEQSTQGSYTTESTWDLIVWAVGSHFKSFKQGTHEISIISMDPELSIHTPRHGEISPSVLSGHSCRTSFEYPHLVMALLKHPHQFPQGREVKSRLLGLDLRPPMSQRSLYFVLIFKLSRLLFPVYVPYASVQAVFPI